MAVRGITDVHNRDSVAGQRAGLDCGCERRGSWTSETVEAYDARTGERLDYSEEVRKGRAKEVRELDEVEVKREVDESEMRVTPGNKIWSKMGGHAKGSKQPSNTVSVVCHGSEHG